MLQISIFCLFCHCIQYSLCKYSKSHILSYPKIYFYWHPIRHGIHIRIILHIFFGSSQLTKGKETSYRDEITSHEKNNTNNVYSSPFPYTAYDFHSHLYTHILCKYEKKIIEIYIHIKKTKSLSMKKNLNRANVPIEFSRKKKNISS